MVEIANIVSKEFSLITEFAIVSMLTAEIFYTLNEQVNLLYIIIIIILVLL